MAVEDAHLHHVLIVGAGPCGLAVAAHLCEPLPSALFADNEHQKFRSYEPPISDDQSPHTQVDAPTPAAWIEKFSTLAISHLRSPMFFHCDPRDGDGLLAFAYMNKRERELKEIKGVEESLNAREPAEFYACTSNTEQDVNGRCIKDREAEAEAEPAELYACASNTKRDVNGRCIKE
ncbi:hypothetical protein BDZ45DRAFT_738046 [Acephala macrosclerotiorum]|nr:hypothetical protein BDZ45DRAFT_738046 [Acephala macrosclerotiorum]